MYLNRARGVIGLASSGIATHKSSIDPQQKENKPKKIKLKNPPHFLG
jgi:hypothetical protein